MSAPKNTGSALQNVEDRLRKLYGIAGDLGVSFRPEISLQVDAGTLLGPGTSLYRGRRWSWQSSVDLTAAGAAQSVHFWAPTIIDKIWWVARGGGPFAMNILVSPPGSGLPANFRSLFWREIYDSDYVNGNPPMFNSAWSAGGAAASAFYQGVATTSHQEISPELYLPGQLPTDTAGNVYAITMQIEVAHNLGFAWGMFGRMF